MINLWIFASLIPVALCIKTLLGLSRKTKEKRERQRFDLFKHWLLIFILGFALAVCSLFFINTPGLINDEDLEIAKSPFEWKASAAENNAYKFIGNNFLFIDDSFNKNLTPYAEGTDGDSTTVAITDRRMIVQLLSNLNHQSSLVDFVVIDIAFDESTPYDGLLKKELDSLYHLHKLILSFDPTVQHPKAVQFPNDVYGNVREMGNDFAFTSHTIKSDDNFLSLAYKIYTRRDSITTTNTYLANKILIERKKDTPYLCVNVFAPKFYLWNEQRLYNNTAAGSNGDLQSMPLQNLGFSITPFGKELLSEEMAQRKKNHLKNIVFIGAFKSPDEDVHETGYGKLHGPVIILNVFYALCVMQHHVSLWLFLYLLAGFVFINYVLISCIMFEYDIDHPTAKFAFILHKWNAYVHNRFKEIAPIKNILLKKVADKIKDLLNLLWLVVTEETEYLVLIIFILSTRFFFGFMLNWQILLIYFIAFEKTLKYFVRKNPKHRSHEKIKNPANLSPSPVAGFETSQTA